MKIIHIANFHLNKFGSTFYYTDRKISNGFIRSGHYVYDFSYRDEARNASLLKRKKMGAKKMNKRIIELCYNINPDFIMFGKAEMVNIETLRTIKQSFPKIKTALWHVDAIYYDKEIKHITNQLEFLDAVFITTGGKNLDIIRNQYPQKTFFFPNPVDSSIDYHKNFLYEKFKYDVVFCGRDRNRIERRKYFKEISTIANKKLNFSFNGVLDKPIKTGNNYLKTLSQAPMGLNISDRFDIEYYSSDRVAQLTGNGLCTFSPYVPHFEKLYNEKEMVYYKNTNELIEKLIFYKENPQERKKIAQAGWQRAQQDYNSTRIAQYLIDATFQKPLLSYHWATY